MTIQNTSIMGMITGKMNYLTQRQKVLSQNIANADTPNYRAKDLKPFHFEKLQKDVSSSIQVATTSASHIIPASSRDLFDVNRRAESYEVTPDGNKVVIEEQLMKLNAVNGEHKLATSLHKKYVGLYRSAMSAPQ